MHLPLSLRVKSRTNKSKLTAVAEFLSLMRELGWHHAGIKVGCSDQWQHYLNVLAAMQPVAHKGTDRFHIAEKAWCGS